MTTDDLRAKFEAWWKENYWYVDGKLSSLKHYAWMGWLAAHASRDAEVEALRKDAARYRWLRSRVAGTDRKPFICIFHGNFSLWNGEHADCEIDAAMQEESK